MPEVCVLMLIIISLLLPIVWFTYRVYEEIYWTEKSLSQNILVFIPFILLTFWWSYSALQPLTIKNTSIHLAVPIDGSMVIKHDGEFININEATGKNIFPLTPIRVIDYHRWYMGILWTHIKTPKLEPIIEDFLIRRLPTQEEIYNTKDFQY